VILEHSPLLQEVAHNVLMPLKTVIIVGDLILVMNVSQGSNTIQPLTSVNQDVVLVNSLKQILMGLSLVEIVLSMLWFVKIARLLSNVELDTV
jgi:hypothetical protein